MNPEDRIRLPDIAFHDFKKRFVPPDVAEGFQDIVTVDFMVSILSQTLLSSYLRRHNQRFAIRMCDKGFLTCCTPYSAGSSLSVIAFFHELSLFPSPIRKVLPKLLRWHSAKAALLVLQIVPA